MTHKLSEAAIVQSLAEALTEKLLTRCIHDLEDLDTTLSGEDSGLDNVWDEICVQMQVEESFSWDAYVETIDTFLEGYVDELQRYELDALWLHTGAGQDWAWEDEDERGDAPVFKPDVVDHLRERLLSKASDWTNERIEQYLERHYE